MTYVLLAFLIPFSFAGADFCTDIGRIMVDYEKDFAKARVSKCSEVKVADLIKGFEGLSDEKFLEQRKCNSLASIESELERLRAQLSVANGIMKLKTTVDESQRDAAAGSRQAGMTFVSSLNTAQSLEVLLATSSHQNKPFIQMLKELPAEQRKNQLDLSNAIKKFCEQKSSADQDACNPKLFKPNPDAANEILKMVESTNDLSEVQVTKWQSMLAIQKANSEEQWSFSQMKQELEGAFQAIDSNQVMTREHLNAIKKLDNFKHAPGFSFVEDIAALKNMNKAKIQSDKLLVLLGDAKLRQQYEAQSKMSVVWDNNKSVFSSLSFEKQQNCQKAKFLFSEAKLCQAHLVEAAKNITDADLKNTLLPSIKASMDYADKLESSESQCKTELAKNQSKVVPESCYSEVGKVPADLQQQIRQLNILKDKIGSENLDKMTYRNFAMMKWAEKCGPQQSSMDQCDLTDDYAISKNAMLAVKDSLDVAVMFSPKPDAEKKAQELCENEEKQETRKPNETKLCNLFNSTPVVIQTNNVAPTPQKPEEEKFDPVAAQNRDRMIMASKGLLTDALKDWLNYRFNSPTNSYYNPYPYNYAPYNYGQPPMGIADSIMFNARYYGSYGFYMPTPGYQPYTAFGSSSSLSAYKPAATVYPSRYFGK